MATDMANNIFSSGDRVVLTTFHNTKEPSVSIDPGNNYWVLIGESGVVVDDAPRAHPAFPDKEGRILVQFDKDIRERGLHCHNEIPNSLWIFATDLNLAE